MSEQNGKRDPDKRIKHTEETYTWRGFVKIFLAAAFVAGLIVWMCPTWVARVGASLALVAGSGTVIAIYGRSRYPQSILAITHAALLIGGMLLAADVWLPNENWPNVWEGKWMNF